MRRLNIKKIDFSLLLCLCSLAITACTSSSVPAPVSDAGNRHQKKFTHKNNSENQHAPSVSNITGTERPKLTPGTAYTAKPGDTLYAIAWMYGADVRVLAEQNAIKAPYNVYTGQVLHYSLPNADLAKNNSTESTALPDHRVKVGDSLSILAEKNGFRLSELGAFNHIKPPFVIHPGQIIHFPAQPQLKPENDATNSPSFGPKDSFHEERAVDQKSVKSNKKSVVAENETAYAGSTKQIPNKLLTWRWPTKGKVVGGFNAGDQSNKGIDISGKRGQPVVAAASGRVVYAGNALRGYGNLIIIKHNEDYLSAYAHNDTLRVTEQQVVKAGQKIADMGSSESSDVRLHFEIRYHGQSVNPLRYLPKR
jgi:Membrane proteins related to metalloendopeptidases